MTSNFNYYLILSVSYGVGFSTWWMILKYWKDLTPAEPDKIFKAWWQISGIFICAVFTILIGRLYMNGYLIPDLKVRSLDVAECANQLLIYSPFPLFILITRQSLASAWFSTDKLIIRIGIGFAISIISVAAFVLFSQQRSFADVLADVYNIKNTHHLVQVFMEDLAIALLLSRFAAALKPKYFAIGLVAVGLLFSFGHLPNNLSSGANTLTIFMNALIDAGLVTAVGFLLYRSRDFIWLWPIHYAMDMMQFYSGMSLEH